MSKETDEQVKERIKQRYQVLEQFVHGLKSGAFRSLIVSGPPGMSKSFEVNRILEQYHTMELLKGEKFKSFDIIKGSISPVGLYKALYQYSEPNCVLVVDDANSIFEKTESRDLLLAACDTSKKRIISWKKSSKDLEKEGIPNTFEYHGGAIFLTNLNFSIVKNRNTFEHLNALKSRSQMINMGLNTTREKILCIRMKLDEGMLDRYKFTDDQVEEIFDYIWEKQNMMSEISLRVVVKIADLFKSCPAIWRMMADESCLI